MTAAASAAESCRAKSVKDIYTQGSGDRVRVIVYGEDDLSDEFDISGAGEIAYPLNGQVASAIRYSLTYHESMQAFQASVKIKRRVNVLWHHHFWAGINRWGR